MAGAQSVFVGLAKEQFGLILGIGVGEALAAALEPQVVAIRQAEYRGDPLVAVDPATAAAIVAEAVELVEWGTAEAANYGIDPDRFAAIVGEVLNAPGLGELLRMLRRETITPDDFLHGLRKSKFEKRWDTAVDELQHERLDPAIIATSIQRGIMADPGVLPVGPPTGVGNVTPMPVSGLDTLKEAAASGYSEERLAVLARIVGLPASPDLAARMVFRNIIKRVDFDRAIAEGNTRNEWADSLFEGFREIVTAHDGIEGRLRGWLTDAEMYAQTARHGMSQADTDLLFKITGRPLAFHQVFIGERRGGKYDGPTTGIDPAFLKSLRESNIRPEWYDLAWAQRYTYPAAFVLRGLTEAGDLTEAETHDILLFEGWEPTLAAKVSARWAAKAGVGGKADPHVAKADTQLWTTLHKSYIAEEIDATTATATLTVLGAADIATVLSRWDAERALIRAQLTPTQIRKALRAGIINPATGLAWTVADATAALLARGYDQADATVFLQE